MYDVVVGWLLTLNRDKGSRFKDKAKLSVDLVNDINLNQCWHFFFTKKKYKFSRQTQHYCQVMGFMFPILP